MINNTMYSRLMDPRGSFLSVHTILRKLHENVDSGIKFEDWFEFDDIVVIQLLNHLHISRHEFRHEIFGHFSFADDFASEATYFARGRSRPLRTLYFGEGPFIDSEVEQNRLLWFFLSKCQ